MVTPKHLIPIMRQAGGGAIVNMSSRNAFRSTAGSNAYDTTKPGLLGLMTGSSLIADGGQRACMNNDRLMEIPSLAS